MSWLLLAYLVAFVVTLLIIVIAAAMCFQFRAAAVASDASRADYEMRARNLPEATRWADLNHRVADLQEQHDRLRDSLQDAEFTITQALGAEKRLNEAQDRLLELQPRLVQLEQAKADLQLQRDEIERSQENARALRLEADQQEIRRDRIQEERASLEAKLEKEQAEYDAKIGRAQGDLAEVQRRVDAAKVEEAALAAGAAGVRQELIVIESQIKSQTVAKEQLDRDLKAIQEEYRELRIQRDSVHAQLEAERVECESLKNVIATLRTDYEILLKNLTSGEHAHDNAQAELWLPVFTSRSGGQEIGKEQAALEAVEKHLDETHLSFSPRTIRAFHTCLKVAEESPLTVLAGISGTGKSELPRRYAEALGIHFLSLPVQPRWDSPQDLFGFFNYLEGRYRPTELTRALLQFDPFEKRESRGWRRGNGFQTLNDQMLVVLLDEMNLARVEYYFSDLLSKLETRRGVSSDDDLSRAKAEIILEVGRSANSAGRKDQSNTGGAALLRLFVDTNVLFVGTMNEDESTQTLSDKVIDRSNVLRFGKPNQLATGGTGPAARPKANPLTYRTWKKWRRPFVELPDDAQERVQSVTGRLNSAMYEIGRPFAYRMDRAISAYVANYLTHTPEGVNQALSDQIEFRILPRLRGLDPNEDRMRKSLSALTQILDDLEDNVLRNAVDAARSGGQHQFAWSGIDRSQQAD